MGFQPWYQHQTYPAISIPLNVEGATDNITGLTPSSLTMIIRNLQTNTDTTGTGTFTITTANPALVTYQFSDADTMVGLNTELIVKANFPGPPAGVAVYDPIQFPFTAS